MRKNIVFIAIILLIILLRTINWPNSIQEMNSDEIMTVVNAVSILKTQHDITGMKNPVYLLGWGGQSVVLLYLMVLSIKLFGYSIFAVRLPLLIVSLLTSIIFYDFVRRITKNKTIAQISLIAVLISPWHILQSIWGLDCNMFPHFLLIAVYLLYIAIEKQNNIMLYISMFAFAITLYCYGVAMYFVPLFLLILAIYLLKTKKITFSQVIICFLIFIIVALPIIITFAINVLNIKKSIEFCNITIPYYEYLTRTNDMLLFSENIFSQLITNIKALFKTLIMQFDGCKWNSSIYFGTIYHISLIFVIISILDIAKRVKNKKLDFGFFIIIAWLLISLLTGLLINSTNINRMNSIWYLLIFLTSYGIYLLFNVAKHKKIYMSIIAIIYISLFITYTVFFNLSYSKQVSNSECFSRGFMSALDYISTLDKNTIYYTNFENDGCLKFYIDWENTKNNKDIKKYECINNPSELNNIINNINDDTIFILNEKDFDMSFVKDNMQITKFGEYNVITYKNNY